MFPLSIVAATVIAAPLSAGLVFPLAVRWRAPLPSGPSAPAAADAEQVFVPLRSGRLAALARASGLERWSQKIRPLLRPVYGDGLVFAAVEGGLMAFEARTGEHRWTVSGGTLAAPPCWRDGWLVAGIADGDLVAMRARDGSIVWRRQPGRLSAAPTIDGDRLFLPFADGRVAVAALADGRELWSRQLGGSPSPILVDDERIFVGARDNYFYCLDARRGAVRWRWRTGADVIGLAAIDERRVYFVSLDNVLRALDRSNGAQRWRRPLPMRPFEGPLYSDGRLIVSGLSPRVLMFNARDGAPAGEWSAGAELAAPVIALERSDVQLIAIAGAISGEWSAIGVGAVAEPPPEPLSVVPGTPLPPERPPSLP